jgi:hypothetical protein
MAVIVGKNTWTWDKNFHQGVIHACFTHNKVKYAFSYSLLSFLTDFWKLNSGCKLGKKLGRKLTSAFRQNLIDIFRSYKLLRRNGLLIVLILLNCELILNY